MAVAGARVGVTSRFGVGKLCSIVGRSVIAGAAIGFTLLGNAKPAHAATAAQVQESLEKAQKFLLSKQGGDGSWEVAASRDPKGAQYAMAGGQWGG